MLFRNVSTAEVQNQGNTASSAVACRVFGAVCRRTKRRFIFWSLMLLQIFFISCFWLLQVDVHVVNIKEIDRGDKRIREDQNKRLSENRIHFVTEVQKIPFNTKTEPPFHLTEVTSFNKDFILSKRDIKSLRKYSITNISSKYEQTLCFREGTAVFVSQVSERNLQKSSEEGDEEEEEYQPACKCLAEWHGIDCGQPEVIWRTLMTARSSAPLMLQQPMAQNSHRLIYMLSGYFFSLDFLELQIKTVIDCVDYFVINVAHAKVTRNHIKAIDQHLRGILKAGQYLINHCGDSEASGGNTKKGLSPSCSPKQAYKLFKRAILHGQITETKPTDIFIYSHDDEILNRKALKFIKYYYNLNLLKHGPSVMQFRLKHVVYGFYWQHPNLTQVSGILSSFATLDHPAGGNGDPNRLTNSITATSQQSAIVIGDLNHFGGWYCQYCQQPSEIIDTLQTAQSVTGRSDNVQFPNSTRNLEINVSYLHKLIAQGQHIDGNKHMLIKLRRNSEKYYAPQYAEQYSWKFGNLLLNFYESLENDFDNDDDG